MEATLRAIIVNHYCPIKKHIVPDGTFPYFYLSLYQYYVPYGTVPEELNIGSTKKNPRNYKSRRDYIYQALQRFLFILSGQQ